MHNAEGVSFRNRLLPISEPKDIEQGIQEKSREFAAQDAELYS